MNGLERLSARRQNPGNPRSGAIAEVFVVNAASPFRPKLFLVAVAAISLPGCLDATAFDTEPPVTGVTRDNLDRLSDRVPSSMPFKFVAIGDVHDAYDELAQAVDAINLRDDVDFVAASILHRMPACVHEFRQASSCSWARRAEDVGPHAFRPQAPP
jgi:hypothetical protein